MYRNYFKKLKFILVPIWVTVGFYSSALVVGFLLGFLEYIGVSFNSINDTVLNTVLAAMMYLVALLMVIGLPWLVKRKKTTLYDVGLSRVMSWLDILVTPVGFIVYILFSAGLIAIATQYVPWFDASQAQDTGFDQLNSYYECLLAFVTLVIMAPVAEELLFRGYLFGKLKTYIPTWLAILATSALFGFFHGAWNVGIDTFALGIVLCLLREFTGSIWASIMLHMIKNGIAFYLLFINPAFLTTIVK